LENDTEDTFYKKAYLREKKARKEAEKVLEIKSLELYNTNERLKFLNNNLETELVERLKQTKIIEQEFSSFVNNATDIIYRLDIKGKVTFVNPMTKIISGFTDEEIINQDFSCFIHPDDQEKAFNFYQQQVSSKEDSTYFEYRIKTKYGDEIWLGQNVQLVYKNGTITGFIAIARNITTRKKLEKSIIRSEEKYRGIIENLEFGILEVDTKGIITKAHASFSTLTGYTQTELIGKDPYEFLHPDSHQIMIQQEKNRKKQKADVYEVQIQKKNGDYIWVIVSGAPFYDIDGTQIGSVGIHLDMSERKKMEDDLKEANQKILASSKSKELFLAKVSHEIRTPLNAVIGLADLLLKTELDKKQKNYSFNINKSANNLLLLVNDVLDLTKIDKDKLKINNQHFVLSNFIENIRATLDYLALQKNLYLHINIDNELKNNYILDELRLTQILINLANNAIKFTKTGTVTISLKLVSKKKKNHLVEISVQDTGKGIAADKLEKIFEEFTQESSNIFNTYGGTGLGLTISKKLVELLGGQLNVTSEQGKGTTFFFTIPFKITKKKKKSERISTANPIKDWSNVRILIAEDNLINQLVITETLSSWNAQYKTVENGLEAIEALKEDKFDIVLMDMQMPVMDGIDASKEIRQTLQFNIPIIAFTANAMKTDIQKCLNVGMNDFITKPFKQKELKRKIESLLLSKTTKEVSTPLLSIDKLEELAKGNNVFIVKMLKIFIETSKEQIEILQNSTDSEVIRKIAHKIKPSIDYLATEEMQQLVRKIENKKFEDNLKLLATFTNMLITLRNECNIHLDTFS